MKKVRFRLKKAGAYLGLAFVSVWLAVTPVVTYASALPLPIPVPAYARIPFTIGRLIVEKGGRMAANDAAIAANDAVYGATFSTMSNVLTAGAGTLAGGAAAVGIGFVGAPVWVGMVASIGVGYLVDSYFDQQASDGMTVKVAIPTQSTATAATNPQIAVKYEMAPTDPNQQPTWTPATPEAVPAPALPPAQPQTSYVYEDNPSSPWEGKNLVKVTTYPDGSTMRQTMKFEPVRYRLPAASIPPGALPNYSGAWFIWNTFPIQGLQPSPMIVLTSYSDRVNPMNQYPMLTQYIVNCSGIENCSAINAQMAMDYYQKMEAFNAMYYPQYLKDTVDVFFMKAKSPQALPITNSAASPFNQWSSMYSEVQREYRNADGTTSIDAPYGIGFTAYENKWAMKAPDPYEGAVKDFNLRPEDQQAALSLDMMARLANAAWQKAAQQPGYQGLPYSPENAITAAEVQDLAQRYPDLYPRLMDLLGQVSSNPYNNTVTVLDPLTYNPSTDTGSNQQINVTVDLGPNPGIGSPELENTEAGDVLSPLVNLFPELRSYKVPAHGATCPKGSIDLYGKTLTLDYQCTWFEQNRQAIFAVFQLSWVLVSLFVFLRA